MGNFAENLNLGNRFRPPLALNKLRDKYRKAKQVEVSTFKFKDRPISYKIKKGKNRKKKKRGNFFFVFWYILYPPVAII